MGQREKPGSQIDFGFKTPRRPKERKKGRPRKTDAGVSHRRREVQPKYPLHVTMTMRNHVWNLRAQRCYRVLERAFFVGCERFGARVAHFSVQHNHVHMVVEGQDPRAVGRAMQGLAIRMAKGLNKVMGRKGKVFEDRYHARVLKTPTDVRRVLVYVYGNARKHGPAIGHVYPKWWRDPCSSAEWCGGWQHGPPLQLGPAPVASAASWLLGVGWIERGGGPLRTDEVPAEHRTPRRH